MATSKIDQYNEYIDENSERVTVFGIDFEPSKVLRELDPTAYRCGFNDWLDAEGEEAQKEAEEDGSFDRLP